MSVLNSLTALTDINYDAKLTTNATTTVTSRNSYITAISIRVDTGGTGSTLNIQDAQGSPFLLINGLVTTSSATTPTIYTFGSQGVFMNNGISIITSGAVASTVYVKVQGYY